MSVCRHPKRWWRLSKDRTFIVCDECWARVPGWLIVRADGSGTT